jgi:hypothetical protein
MGDKKPKTAVEAEATDAESIDLEWSGLTLTLPASYRRWPIDAGEAHEEIVAAVSAGERVGPRRLRAFLQAVLGPDQWRIVKARGMSIEDVDDLSTEVFRATFGSTLGE